MSAHFEAKLKELGITLPEAPAPAANYLPFVQVGNIVYVSGQISAVSAASLPLGVTVEIEGIFQIS